MFFWHKLNVVLHELYSNQIKVFRTKWNFFGTEKTFFGTKLTKIKMFSVTNDILFGANRSYIGMKSNLFGTKYNLIETI